MNNKKIAFNKGLFILIVALLIVGVLIAVIVISAQRRDNIVLPDFSNELDEVVLAKSGKLYDVKTADIVLSNIYYSTIEADHENYIVEYVVSNTHLTLGQIVDKNEILDER